MAGLANNLGYKVHTKTFDWAEMVRRSWGAEFNAPDHAVYEFSNGRQFDSTDRGTTGIYNPNFDLGFLIANAQYPDMPAYLLTGDGHQLNQG